MRAYPYSRALMLGAFLALAGCDQYPPVESTQQGFRGTAMVEFAEPGEDPAAAAQAAVPAALPQVPPGGPKAGDVYKNVKVLGHLDAGQFGRLMASITAWVAPKEGCVYCHEAANFADDSKYTKVVSRRMIEMTLAINTGWTDHVKETGVTCYTCHAGQNIPANNWSRDPGPVRSSRFDGNQDGQNYPARSVGLSSLPFDPYTPFLLGASEIRVNAPQALPTQPPHAPDILSAERTYGLMMHMSDSLGVNCTFCHNSRAFAVWEESNPQRVTAWHGIRMVRQINADYIEPLGPVFPQNRLGALGDPLKANCSTCHQGLNKPLGGLSMLKDHPELGAPAPVTVAKEK